MDSTNKWFNYLYKERGLSAATIQRAGLSEKDGWLEIPIFNAAGTKIFSKYRKPPWEESDEPKYKYDAGSKVALYGVEKLLSAIDVYITEGELDVLTLRTVGEEAVTSTGGALSFKNEWGPMFEGKDVSIIFDNDEAGIKGAARVSLMLRSFCFRWVPPMYGKDVNDVLGKYGMKKLYDILNDEEYCVRMFIPPLKNQRAIKAYRRNLSEKRRDLTNGSIGYRYIQEVIFLLNDMLKPATKKRDRDFKHDLDKDRAKSYPMENLLEFKQRKARCPFHDDKTASFHLYKNNTGFCFGCRKYADSIDIVMQTMGKDFKQAVNYLKNK